MTEFHTLLFFGPGRKRFGFAVFCLAAAAAASAAGNIEFDNPTNLPALADFVAADADAVQWCAELVEPGLRPAEDDTEARMILHNAALRAETDSALRGRLLKAFHEVLASDRPEAIKEFVFDELKFIAGDESLEAVAPFFLSPSLCDRAARVAVNAGTPAAAAKLKDAFCAATDAKVRLCLAQALALLPHADAAPALLEAAQSGDADLRLAALEALAACGDSGRAATALKDAARNGAGYIRAKAQDAYLAFLRRQAAGAAPGDAVEGALSLLEGASGKRHLWYACLEICGIAGGARALETLMNAWNDTPAELRPELARVLAAQAGGLPVPIFLEAMKSDKAEARIAVLDALSRLGIAGNSSVNSALQRLVEAASSDNAAERAAAAAALVRLKGADVEAGITALAADEAAASGTRMTMLSILAARKVRAAAPVMLKTARNADAELRLCALRGLSATAAPEHAPAILELARAAAGDAERAEAVNALVALSRRPEDKGRTAKLMISEAESAAVPLRAALAGALSRVGGEDALAAARRAVASAEEPVRDAAVRALAEWPDAAPMEDLLALARTEKSSARRHAALMGYARMAALKTDAAPSEMSGVYEQALALAETGEERMAIQGLRKDMLRQFASKKPQGAADVMLKLARDADAEVRLCALQGLSAAAAPEHAPAILELARAAAGDAERAEAVNALVALSRRPEDKGRAAKLMIAELNSAAAPLQAALARALSRVGGEDALAAARRAVASAEEPVRDAAVRALAEWPDAAPMEDLAEVIAKSGNEVHRILALGGYARMVGLKPGLEPAERCELYEQAMAWAERDEERRLILSMLGKVGDMRALKYLEEMLEEFALLSDAALMPEAETAYVDVAVSLAKSRPAEVREALQQFYGATKNEKERERALQAIRAMDEPK